MNAARESARIEIIAPEADPSRFGSAIASQYKMMPINALAASMLSMTAVIVDFPTSAQYAAEQTVTMINNGHMRIVISNGVERLRRVKARITWKSAEVGLTSDSKN